jgi:formylmethanofuran dehydrogenase subunit B
MTTKVANVVIPTAVSGIQTAGTMYRMDGVPLPLTKILDSDYPSDFEVLSRIIAGIRRRRGLTESELFHADAENRQRASL